MALTKSEKLILKAMYQEHRPMSIREISEKAGVSWATVKKYIPKLLAKQYIKTIKDRKRKYYKFNYEKIQV